MYILYLDESGTHAEAAHLVVAGIALFERSTFWLSQRLDEVVDGFFPGRQREVCLHATQMWVPEGQPIDPPFCELTATERRALAAAVYGEIVGFERNSALFATAIEKQRVQPGRDVYEVAFEDIVSRFDLFLSRLHAQGNTQRGLIVVAASNYQERLETLGERILREGTQWSRTRNLAEIPLFTPAANSRLLQVADFVSNAVYGYYERGLSGTFMQLVPRFDREGDRLHGLTHLTGDARACFCPACMSWRTAQDN